MIERFLLAKLHLESLSQNHSKSELKEALGQLPEELNGTYEEAISRIGNQSKKSVALATFVFSWVTCARAPLHVAQLQYALAVQLGNNRIDKIVSLMRISCCQYAQASSSSMIKVRSYALSTKPPTTISINTKVASFLTLMRTLLLPV
jgi:hypothetical protein